LKLGKLKGKLDDGLRMPRSGTVRDAQPYQPFGIFAGLAFWEGGLTLLSAAPGIGKTSWLLSIAFEAALAGYPAAVGCYEHTPEELKFRLSRQAEASLAGAHGAAARVEVARRLARGSLTALLPLSAREDTVRAVEEYLIQDYGFPAHGPAVLAIDYLQRIPVVGLGGMVPEERRSGEAAVELRSLARRHGWGVIAACAMKVDSFKDGADLSALLGDERVPYEADRVLVVRRVGPVHACGCVDLEALTLKDRTGPARTITLAFWGARFYPALGVRAEDCGG
jgi:hypothetical protein